MRQNPAGLNSFSLTKEIKTNFQSPILVGSSLLVLLILSLAMAVPVVFQSILSWVQNVFVLYFSWFYVLLVFSFFCICLYLAFGPYRKLRLGKALKPQYSFFTWIAMLFSAGMGTGLLFSGVYEPVYHYLYPPTGQGGTEQALALSFQLTFLHWGFSGWAVYTLMGLAIAYLCKNRPPKISCMLYPIRLSALWPLTSKQPSPENKKTTSSAFGTAVDILSVTVILLGLATTLGRGALQINYGLEDLFNLPYSRLSQSGIILVLTLIATLSLLSGLNKGIRRLSELNIIVCFLLLLFVLFAGPTAFLLGAFVEHSVFYLKYIWSAMIGAHTLGSAEWRSKWTILYWAWWIAWAPFVGLFIARISEGRSIRQFVLGALIVPTAVSCFWFVIFGGTAIQLQSAGAMDLKPILQTEYSGALFEFLKHLPFTPIMSALALFAVGVFFVTSSDSASYVIHTMSCKRASRFNKVYWALLEGLLAMTLIYFGGIKSLELLVIVMAFPFALLLCLICFAFFKELKKT